MANGVIIAITGTGLMTPDVAKKLADSFREQISKIRRDNPQLKMAIQQVRVEEVIE